MVTKYLVDGTKKGLAKPGAATIETATDINTGKTVTLLKGTVIRLGATPRVITDITLEDLDKANIRLMTKFKVVNPAGFVCPFLALAYLLLTPSRFRLEVDGVYGAYPFVGIGDDMSVATEDPEGYVLFFDVAEFRNAESPNIPRLNFKLGDHIIVKAPFVPERSTNAKARFAVKNTNKIAPFAKPPVPQPSQ